MSTRANIIIIDDFGEKLYFYRHSDGYPKGALPLLDKFVDMVNKGEIRRNAEQAAGWLILLGAFEDVISKGLLYTNYDKAFGTGSKHLRDLMPSSALKSSGMEWKVGQIEPSIDIHGDIEYLYIIDLSNKPVKIEVLEDNFEMYSNK